MAPTIIHFEDETSRKRHRSKKTLLRPNSRGAIFEISAPDGRTILSVARMVPLGTLTYRRGHEAQEREGGERRA